MTSHILKYGDLIVIQGSLLATQGSKKDSQNNQGPECTGFMSALGYTDNRVFLQAIPKGTTEALKVASNWNNYRELVFQLWPKVSYEAHKQLKKLRREKAALVSDDAKALLDEKIKKMKNRAEEERTENMKMINQHLGHSVTYGTEIQLMHYNSKSFLSSRVACSDSDKSAYKFELIKEFNSGMSFMFKPKFKIRQEGDPVQLKDQVLLYSMKMKCYVNFANDKPIELDEKLDIPGNLPIITAPFEHRQLSQGCKRFEAFVSQTKDCFWELHPYGAQEPNDNKIRGGHLIKLKYTENNSYLAADIAMVTKNPEVVGQEYQEDYEHKEEANNINTIWEVEIEAEKSRGETCTVTESASNPQPIRLRHLLTGKLLGIENVSGSALGLDDSRSKALAVAVNYEPAGQQKKPTIIFKSFASDTSGDLTYSSAYGIGVSDETGSYKFIKAVKNEDVSIKRQENKSKAQSTELYKPLDENDSAANKVYMLCENNEASPEHAFMPLRISPEEEDQINFVATSVSALKYFRDLLKSSKSDDINPNAISKALDLLKDLIFFVHKTDDNDEEENDPIEYDGIVSEEKQRLLKDFKVIELLTEILYYPFQRGIANLDDIGKKELCKVFQCCYRLIKHIIKEYRPNEIYAAQWLELYMDQAMKSNKDNDIKAGATLIELIDNNDKILADKIDTEMIEKFVKMLKENKHKKYVKLLRALCVCNGKPVGKNQQDMSTFIIEDRETRDHLIYQNFKFVDGKVKIWVNEDSLLTLNEFQNSLEFRDQYKYFISMIYLLADLCLDRNLIAINFLQTVYTYELCFQIVTEELPKDQAKDKLKDDSHASYFKIKSAFARLINNLWVDTPPYQPLNVPQYLILWDEINPINCRQITCTETDASRFNSLKEHLQKYFDSLAKDGCTRIYKVDKNKFTSIIVEIATRLVKFGFYTDVEQIKGLLKPLLVLLNGMQDASTPQDFDRFKAKLKSTRKAKKTIYVGTGDLDDANHQRYEENRETTIVMDCKNKICELIKLILTIDDDLRLRQYLLEFKNELSSTKGKDQDASEYAKSPEKKSRFSNYQKLLFRGNEDEPIDFIQNSLNWIKTISERNTIDLKALAPADFGRILYDLCLYDHEDLNNNAFDLLNNTHSQRMRLKEMLENVHILEDPEKKKAVLAIEEDIKILQDKSERSELWYLDKKAAATETAKQFIQLVRKLGGYLVNDSLLFKGQNEPEEEIITKANAHHSPDAFEEEDGYEEEHGVDSEFQTILRHLKVHEPLLAMLRYESQRPADPTHEIRIAVIREICKFLAKFAAGAKANQNLLMDDMQVLLEIMTRYSSSGVDELIEVLFKNNRGLIRQVEEIKKFAKSFLLTISKLKLTHPRSSKMLMSLEPFMKYNNVPIKVNQTAILALLTHREFSNIFMALDSRKTSKDEIVKDDIFKKIDAFNNMLENPKGLVELPPELDYLCSLLEVLSCTCDGKNAVTESRSQNVWPLRQLLVLYERSDKCWILKRSILLFVFHVYLETERGMREGDDLHKLIFEHMVEDMKYVAANPISRYEIHYHKGNIDNKQAQELFYFESVLPCINKSFETRFFGQVDQYTEKLRNIFACLLDMKQLGLTRAQRHALNKTINLFRIHAQEVYKEGIDKAKLDNLELVDLSRDMSKRMSISGSSMNLKEEATKDSKLKMRLSMLGERIEFIECAENEFEEMIKILIDVEKPEQDTIFSSPISFDKVIESLIGLVTKPNQDQELMLVGLKTFRKIIESENRSSNLPAADWDGEEWTKYERKVIQRQNQLCDLNVVDMICKIISENEENFAIQQECILVGIAMLLGGNEKVQEAFCNYIQEDASNEFMFKIKLLIEKNFAIVKKEMSLKNRFYNERLTEKENAALYKKAAKPNKIVSPKGASLEMGASGDLDEDDDIPLESQAPDGEEAEQSLSILQRTYRFLQLFCEGHYKPMQDQLREQTDKEGNVNGKSQDFISRTAYYFNTLIKQINVDSLDFGVQMLDFLIEAMQGPCEANQKALAKAKIINSCMDFLTSFKQDRDYHKQGFLDEKDRLRVNDATTTATKLLNTLIEGSNDPEIIDEMATLDFKFLIFKLSEEYKTFVNDTLKLNVEAVTPAEVTQELNADSFNQQILESFDVYILMANLADSNKKVDDLLKNTEEYTALEQDALDFFRENLCDIEIKFRDKLLKVFFPKYPICRHLSKDSRKDLMLNVNRDSGNEKVMGLVNAADDLFDEMTHMAFLKEQVFKFNMKRFNYLRDISTVLSLLINIIILSFYYYHIEGGISYKKNENMGYLSTEQTINVLGYLQIGTSSLMIVFWIIINGPIILKRKWRDFNKKHKPDDEGQDMLSFLEEDPDPAEVSLYHALLLLERKGPYDPIFNPNGKRNYGHLFVKLVCYWRNLVFIMTEGKFVFMVFYLSISIMGVALSEITYCFHLLDVINRFDTLRNVVKSVTHNLNQLLLTSLLGIILIYIYALIGFYFIDDTYFNPDVGSTGERSCTSMFHCYMTTLNYGLRNGGGIGESLTFLSYEVANRKPYFFRLVFDLSFFIIINVVFLNIIFGIIIDTFAELRDNKKTMDDDMKNKCFICNIERAEFDKNSTGFEKHIEKRHYLWDYLFFIYSVKVKDSTEYNGIESYVQEKLESEDASWFPLNEAIELQEDNQE